MDTATVITTWTCIHCHTQQEARLHLAAPGLWVPIDTAQHELTYHGAAACLPVD